MLRKIVGWVRHPGDQWEIVMRNMRTKVQNAMRQYLVKPWDVRIKCMRTKYFQRLAGMEEQRWEKLSLQWDPAKVNDYSQDYVAHRLAGRPIL